MKVVILSGGKGTRLLPYTLETPKTLLKINGRAILQRILESLPSEVDEIIIVVKHLKDKIQQALGDNFQGKKIVYVEQGEMSGTFGAVLSAKGCFNSDERFLVTNGDDLHDKSEFEECLKYPRAMAVQKKVMPGYFRIEIDSDGYFIGFKTQTHEEEMTGTLVATGVYVLDTKIFDHPGIILGSGEYGLPQSVSEQSKQFPVKVIEVDGWVPVNTISDMEKAEEYFKKFDLS